MSGVARRSRLELRLKPVLREPYSVINRDNERCEYLLIYYKIVTDDKQLKII
jgi:hypothetical protein